MSNTENATEETVSLLVPPVNYHWRLSRNTLTYDRQDETPVFTVDARKLSQAMLDGLDAFGWHEKCSNFFNSGKRKIGSTDDYGNKLTEEETGESAVSRGVKAIVAGIATFGSGGGGVSDWLEEVRTIVTDQIIKWTGAKKSTIKKAITSDAKGALKAQMDELGMSDKFDEAWQVVDTTARQRVKDKAGLDLLAIVKDDAGKPALVAAE